MPTGPDAAEEIPAAGNPRERDFRRDVEGGVVSGADNVMGRLGSENAADGGAGGAGNDGESGGGAGERLNGGDGG